MNFADYWAIASFVAVQTVVITWWAATQTQRANNLEKELASLSRELDGHAGTGERMTRIEGAIENIKAILDDRLPPKRRNA